MKLHNHVLEKLEITVNDTVTDFSADFLGIEIFEDIFQPFLSGNLYINDTGNVLSKYPLVGNEEIYISIKINSPTKQTNIEFKNLVVIRTNSLDINKFQIKQSTAYTIHWTEKEGLNALNEFSISYKEKKISEMVDDISTNMITKTLTNVDDTKLKYDIAFPYMTPIEMIHYVSSKYAETAIGKYGFVYYTDINQETHYRSLSQMMNALTTEYRIFITNKTEMVNTNIVIENQFASMLNIDMLIKKGYFGSQNFYYDSATKEVVATENTIEDFISNNNFLGKKSLYNKELKEYKLTRIRTDESLIDKNIALFSSLSNYNMIFKQQGDFTKKVGMLVDVDINAHIIDKSEKIDEKFSGKWLCIKQTHQLNANGYEIFSTMVKNAFNKSTMTTVESV